MKNLSRVFVLCAWVLSFFLFSVPAHATYYKYSFNKYDGYGFSKKSKSHSSHYQKSYSSRDHKGKHDSGKKPRHRNSDCETSKYSPYYSKSSYWNKNSKHENRWHKQGSYVNTHQYKSCRSRGHSSHHHDDSCKPENTDLKPIAVDDSYAGVVGEPFSQNIFSENDTAGDGETRVYFISGDLANGLNLQSDGSFSGTPAQAGTFTFKYKIKDKDYDKSYAFVTVVIDSANLLPEAIDDDYTGMVGDQFRQNIFSENDTAGDGETLVEYVSGDPLPEGLVIDTDGNITGSPTVSGIFVFTYKISDEDSDQATADVTITIEELLEYCAISAVADQYRNGSSSHSFWIPEIFKNLVFDSENIVRRVLPTGDITIVGSISDGDVSFDVNLTYTKFADVSHPKLELNSNAYITNGGPIDPATWDFFGEVTGTLTGSSGLWNGVVLEASMTGPIAQIGLGASGKNIEFGFSNWFKFKILSEGGDLPAGFHQYQELNGDININLVDDCIVEPPLEPIAVDDQMFVNGDCYGINNPVGINILANDDLGAGLASIELADTSAVPFGFSLTEDGQLFQTSALFQPVRATQEFSYEITDLNGLKSTALVEIIINVICID